MAKNKAFWGIDIGQCALKAMRCRAGDEPDKIVADAFDYIEYPRILSQPGGEPDADPVTLVKNALDQFLSRNSVRGDGVAVSVSGQSGLTRFIKLPPVETKKIPDIVKYEAKQQIPFALTDVVWRFQRMLGGSETDGYALETEVGLFAMKREQVYRALQPFTTAGIEVDVVQLSPLALYNFIVFEQMQNLPPPEQYNPESPPESIVVLSLGTETTDLVVTNGYRVWQRSIPLGGSHFTKALTKELKITYAKAEHLKRNAQQSDNAKAVFQAMRPVFGDLLTEVQRSIGYHANIDRTAKIRRIVALGNGMKLHGLQKFLAQGLGLEVVPVTSYRGLAGPTVVDAPMFKENALAYGVCYGLSLQGLRTPSLDINLLPDELATARMIREKKPWTVAAAAVLMLGITTSFLGAYRGWSSVKLTEGSAWQAPLSEAKTVSETAKRHTSDFTTAKTDLKNTYTIGGHLVHNVEGRRLWLELLQAINVSLPTDPPNAKPEEITQRNELYITGIDCLKVKELKADWYDGVKQYFDDAAAGDAALQDPANANQNATAQNNAATNTGNNAATNNAATTTAGTDPAATDAGPSGEGWVVRITGFHFHNSRDDMGNTGPLFVRKTIIENLKQEAIAIPQGEGLPPLFIPVKELGISYPVVVAPTAVIWDYELTEGESATKVGGGGAGGAGMTGAPGMAGAGMAGAPGMAGAAGMRGRGVGGAAGAGGAGAAAQSGPLTKIVPRHSFVIEFAWQETPASARLKKQLEKAQQQSGQASESVAGNVQDQGGTN